MVKKVLIAVLGGGILVTVLLNLYSKSKNEALQAEAKGNLYGVYAAMTAYFDEYKEYAFDFEKIGFVPDGDHYVFGFSFNCPGLEVRPMAFEIESRVKEWPEELRSQTLLFFERIPCTAGHPLEWEVYAVGKVEGKLDVWRINQVRELVNLNDRIKFD